MISDQQFLVLAATWLVPLAFAPLCLVAMHHYGHFKAPRTKDKRCHEMKLAIYKRASTHMSCYSFVSILTCGLYAAGMVTYWYAADPSQCAISVVLYVFTGMSWIAYNVFMSACVIALYHGTDASVARVLSAITALLAIFLAISSGYSYGQFDGTRPTDILFAFVVFCVQALMASWYAYFVWTHTAMEDRYRKYHQGLALQKGGDASYSDDGY